MKSQFEFTDVTETWFSTVKNVNNKEEIYILSPYITGSTIKDLFEKSESKNFRVVTKLEISAYVSGALDLDVLRDLICLGVKVFHHPSLHAKILLTKREIVSGSQNFTNGGRKNLEAFNKSELSPKESQIIRKKATDILNEAVLLSKIKIDKFEEICAPLSKDFQKMKEKLQDLEILVQKEGIFDDPKKNLNDQIKSFQNFLSSKHDSVKVQLVERQIETGLIFYDYWTMKRWLEFQVLNRFQSGKIALKSKRKYLCLDATTHSTFIVRANKTQIGQIYNDGTVYITNPKYPGYSYPVVKIDCLTPSDNIHLANLKLRFNRSHLFVLSSNAEKILKQVDCVYVYFNGFSLNLAGIKQNGLPDGQENEEFVKGAERFNEIENFLKPKLKSLIFEREWQYSNGYSSPEKFFDVSRFIELNVGKYRGQYFYTIYQPPSV